MSCQLSAVSCQPGPVDGWLLLRGLVREQRHWLDFPERLAKATGAEVRCLDLPGTGSEVGRASPWSIGEIVEDLRGRFARDGKTWGLLAPSLGGMVALAWGAAHPEDFARIVVINTSSGDVGSIAERFKPQNWRKIAGLLLASDLEARERGVLSIVANSETLDLDGVARTFAGFARERTIPRSTFVRQLRAASKARLPAKLDVPLLVLCSDGDRLVASDCSKRIAERLGAPIEVHPWGGHDLPLDDPDWIVARVVGAERATASGTA